MRHQNYRNLDGSMCVVGMQGACVCVAECDDDKVRDSNWKCICVCWLLSLSALSAHRVHCIRVNPSLSLTHTHTRSLSRGINFNADKLHLKRSFVKNFIYNELRLNVKLRRLLYSRSVAVAVKLKCAIWHPRTISQWNEAHKVLCVVCLRSFYPNTYLIWWHRSRQRIPTYHRFDKHKTQLCHRRPKSKSHWSSRSVERWACVGTHTMNILICFPP